MVLSNGNVVPERGRQIWSNMKARTYAGFFLYIKDISRESRITELQPYSAVVGIRPPALTAQRPVSWHKNVNNFYFKKY